MGQALLSSWLFWLLECKLSLILLKYLYGVIPGICITCVGDQGLKFIQIVIHCLTFLVIGGSFQCIDCIHFHINREEINLELLFKVSLYLDRENTSVCFLMEYVFRPLDSTTVFEEYEGPENSLLFVMELLQDQMDVERAGVQEYAAVVTFSAKVQRTGKLGMCLSYCQSKERRHQRRWYRQRRCVWYRQRGRISH